MYICKDCGDTFDVAKSVTEFQPYGNGYAAENLKKRNNVKYVANIAHLRIYIMAYALIA